MRPLLLRVFAAAAAVSTAIAAPTADEVLQSLAASISDAKHIQFKADVTMNMEIGPQAQTMEQKAVATVARPSTFRLQSSGGPIDLDMRSNGKAMLVHSPENGTYMELPAPTSFVTGEAGPQDEGEVLLAVASGGIEAMYAPFVADPRAHLMSGVASATYVGLEMLDGVEAHRIRLAQPEVNVDLWVRTAAPAVMLKLQPDAEAMAAQIAKQMPGAGDVKVEMDVVFSDWRFDQAPAAGSFSLTPPEGAEKAESLQDLAGMEKSAAEGLVGAAAPGFALPLLAGGEFDLAKEAGKGVLILDFWATWCGPCVMAIPDLLAVAEKYGDRGVRLIGVNQGEGASTVKRFLKRKGFDLSVVMDEEGKAGDLYKVQGIPQTVVIGPDGTVAHVHTGYSPSLGKELSAQLEALLK